MLAFSGIQFLMHFLKFKEMRSHDKFSCFKALACSLSNSCQEYYNRNFHWHYADWHHALQNILSNVI